MYGFNDTIPLWEYLNVIWSISWISESLLWCSDSSIVLGVTTCSTLLFLSIYTGSALCGDKLDPYIYTGVDYLLRLDYGGK